MIKNAQTTKESEMNLWKEKIQNIFTPQPTTEKTFISLSVRSTFDIYLQCRNFPRGTEVLMTAINIPDMV